MLQSGELRKDFSPSDRERFEAHLRECPYCVTYLEQMRATLSALGGFQSSRSNDVARSRLLSAFRDWKRS